MNLIIKSLLIYSLFYSSSLYSEIKLNNKQPSFSISDNKVFNEKPYKLEWNIFCEKDCDHNLAHEIEKNIGPTPMPNSIFQGIFKEKNKILKNVFYSIDQYGLRKSSDPYPEVRKTSHLIIAGDSNIFGEWCKDHETLDYDLSKLLQNSSIKNWGRRGGGPHNTLSQMQFFDYKKSIKQKNGIYTKLLKHIIH